MTLPPGSRCPLRLTSRLSKCRFPVKWKSIGKHKQTQMPVNYQDGKIYTLVNDVNDTIYVGSTAQKYLCNRKSGHVRKAQDITRTSPVYTAMRTLGSDHFKIVLHHSFPCNSKDELVAEEHRTLDAMIASGKQVYNAMIQGKPDQQTREKLKLARIGRQLTDEAKAKIAKAHTGLKHSDETRAKIAKAKKGQGFTFGSIFLNSRRGRIPEWKFTYYDDAGIQHSQSFSVKKYGNFGAHFRAEEARRAVYPEWGNEEDIACDDLGHIEWD